jgi:hypothetical protein
VGFGLEMLEEGRGGAVSSCCCDPLSTGTYQQTTMTLKNIFLSEGFTISPLPSTHPEVGMSFSASPLPFRSAYKVPK